MPVQSCYSATIMEHPDRPYRRVGQGLSARLLVLTIFFVLLAEVLIFLPSIARFRVTYLEEHLASANLVIETLRTMPDDAVTAEQERRLLSDVDAYRVTAVRPDAGKLMLMRESPGRVDTTVDLRASGPLPMIREALRSLIEAENRMLRVVGDLPNGNAGHIEVVIAERPLTDALRAFGERILGLSLIISFMTAALVYLSLHLLLVRPMRRLTESMTRFRRNPEDAASRITPSNRLDEIGVAESELAAMQNDLASALHQKTRLAALGIAMTKISHDLKNMLATAQLISDRLTTSDDPEVRRVAPRLEQTIDRAVNLCTQTLAFSREGPPELHIETISLSALVDDVEATLPARERGEGAVTNDIPAGVTVEADRDQLYRAFVNVMQNAIEAGAREVRVTAERRPPAPDEARHRVHLKISDNGPGLPPRAQENLFQPFAGTVKRGGTGLGLAIARDLVRAHGGDLVLESTTAAGSIFRIELPLRATTAKAAPLPESTDTDLVAGASGR